ncbi:MAG TPA: N-6 DNA methylase [Vicinamibacterales bacterium]
MALKGISGSLASLDLLEALACPAPGREAGPGRLRAVLTQARQALGPTSTARQIVDVLVVPLARELGVEPGVVRDEGDVLSVSLSTSTSGPVLAWLSAGGWNADLRRLRRGTRAAGRWWIGANGSTLRVMDVSRAFTQRAIDFDLDRVEEDDRSLRALQHVFTSPFAALETLIVNTERHRAAVGHSLQTGVEDALTLLVSGFARSARRRPVVLDAALTDALTIVYRILFLLFAEARGLVPQWHPVYRESYTIESLRPVAEGQAPPAGLWQALQAIARLAHRGCTAGTLRVVPFNGRLFAPSAAPLADSFVLDDRIARDVLLAVTTRPAADRRERITYADLGVEQLGAVYERILDYAPSATGGTVTLLPSGRRKDTGTFYTPRTMTEYLVRRTLAPLVRGRAPEEILSLRVVDLAMGSGAFLVAACRYLAGAYEDALIAEGAVARADITAADRAGFRRAVAQRCVYGVDRNPTAVQLARLSLWLCTLAADRPLTFLDHHLRAGNTLAGARAIDVARQPPGPGRRRPPSPLPLFAADDLTLRLASTVSPRLTLARQPDDSAAIVHGKERVIDELAGAAAPLAAWRATADAWCAAWFWPADVDRVTARAWPAFSAAIRGAASGLPAGLERRWRATASNVARRERFFHWELEFPEVFFDERGEPRADAGFDAVIGNPPWAAARELTGFSRESGCYTLQGNGHANLYQLFAERMLQLAAPAGRVGMLMPSGLLTDHGCAPLRQHLFERCTIDAVIGLDNREGLFPIHRGLRFSLITASTSGSTTDLQSRSGVRTAGVLDDVPDEGSVPDSVRVPLTLVRHFSGPGLAVPELQHARDRAILARVLAAAPPLGGDAGWQAQFGRELNATDDRAHFGSAGLPVLEGKLVDPFAARAGEAAQFIDPVVCRRLLGHRARFDRPRLGYREVAASTNRMTLIAAMIPAGAVTTHTIFCMREPRDEAVHWFLCGVFNSFVANYLVRLRGGTHVPAAVIHQLPVPVPARESGAFAIIAGLARAAAADPRDAVARAELQARVTRAYGLDEEDLVHVLATFPIVPEEERHATLSAFRRVRDEL